MDSSRDDRLAATLEELRPEPRDEFAAELDQRAAAGFPRRSRLAALRERLRVTPPRKMLLPVGAAALVVVGAVVTGSQVGGGSSPDAVEGISTTAFQAVGEGDTKVESSSSESFDGGGAYERAGARAAGSEGAATRLFNRSIERSTTMVIGTGAAEVGDAAAQVFDIVHANRGIVLRSSVADGSDEQPGAEFQLLIPSGKLSDALAALSGIGEVRNRNEATADITAPTVGTAEQLEDSRARIDGLLGQLAAATTEAEREAVEAELRRERRRAARLRARLADLKRRANLSRISLRIVPSDGSGTAGWSVGDALDDAGHVLAVATAAAIVALAALAPLALIALLVWLARRAWLSRARTRALG